MSNVVTPTINLNGTSADYLLTAYKSALGALRNTQAALCVIAPHGRDYQTAEPDSLELAREQHFKRVADLELIIADLTEIARGIYGQKVGRDYQTAEPDSLELAREQHFNRVADLELIIADLIEIARGIYGQKVGREIRGKG